MTFRYIMQNSVSISPNFTVPSLTKLRDESMSKETKIQQLLSVLQQSGIEFFEARRDAARLLRSMGDEAFQALLLQAAAPDPHDRETAINGLGWLGNPHAVKQLIALLEDPDSLVKTRAAWALRQIRDKSALPELINALKSTDATVRRAVIWAIVEINDVTVSTIDTLVEALEDRDSQVREAAVYGLGKIETTRSTAKLTELLFANDENDEIKRKIILALAEIKGSLSLDTLVKFMEQHSDSPLISNVLYSIAAFNESATPKLLDLVNSPNDRVKYWAIEIIGIMRSPDGVEPLIASLQNENPKIVERSIVSLGKIGDDRALEPLLRFLQDENYSELVIEALANFTNNSVIETLEDLLNDETLIDAAAASLAQIKNIEAVTPLLQVIDIVDVEVEKKLRQTILGMSEEAVEPLLILLKDNRLPARDFLADILGEIPNSKVVNELQEILRKDTDPMVRRSAVLSLAKIGTDEARQILRMAVDDCDEQIQRIVRKALL